MLSRIKVLALSAAVVSVLSITALAMSRATLTLENGSGENALVRVDGPTSGMVTVPRGQSRTFGVAGGTYRLFIRYGDDGRFSYARGEAFGILDTGDESEDVTVTLQKVVNGNYHTSPSNEREFNGSR